MAGLIHQLAMNGGDLGLLLASQGRIYTASDADQNDLVTGQTSFVVTTPTFLLDVPAGITVVPLMVSLGQTGTVAGDAISVIVELDNADRYASSGTAETVFNNKTAGGVVTNASTLYSNPTAETGYGVRVFGTTVAQDVAPAEGISNEIIWTPTSTPEFLVGPAAFIIYTYAGTTGPTWFWTIKWAEFPTSWLT